jgi:hypothetical protein
MLYCLNGNTCMLQDGDTPLHRAASEGFLAVVCLLLSAGADVNATDEASHPPVVTCPFHATLMQQIMSATPFYINVVATTMVPCPNVFTVAAVVHCECPCAP